jgi:hypothetical protein
MNLFVNMPAHAVFARLQTGFAAAALLAGASASADVVLSGFATADNIISAYVSRTPNNPGRLFLQGSNWPSTFTGSITLTRSGTYYLQVRAQDTGRPEMFIGRFLLDSTDGVFVGGTNGGATLTTGASGWVVSTVGFGVDTTPVRVIAPNGSGPWGNFPLMGSEASFIWSPEYANGIAYFTAEITVGTPSCPADFNADGFLDFFDYADYLGCFETGLCPEGATADFNEDDFVDFFDYADFVENFETGC